MALREPHLPVALLRDAVREAVARTSSHAVARAIGMSAPSLRDFMRGSEPRESTIRKLSMWYVRTTADREGEISEETLRAALALLVAPLPPARRAGVFRELTAALERGYRDAGVPVPGWMTEMLSPGYDPDDHPGSHQ